MTSIIHFLQILSIVFVLSCSKNSIIDSIDGNLAFEDQITQAVFENNGKFLKAGELTFNVFEKNMMDKPVKCVSISNNITNCTCEDFRRRSLSTKTPLTSPKKDSLFPSKGILSFSHATRIRIKNNLSILLCY